MQDLVEAGIGCFDSRPRVAPAHAGLVGRRLASPSGAREAGGRTAITSGVACGVSTELTSAFGAALVLWPAETGSEREDVFPLRIAGTTESESPTTNVTTDPCRRRPEGAGLSLIVFNHGCIS